MEQLSELLSCTCSSGAAGKVKPVTFMPHRMNGQYIIEGISGAMMYTIGGARSRQQQQQQREQQHGRAAKSSSSSSSMGRLCCTEQFQQHQQQQAALCKRMNSARMAASAGCSLAQLLLPTAPTAATRTLQHHDLDSSHMHM
jgi:hypothetical protein